MKLSKLTPCNDIPILSPRWKDRKVLIAKWKVGTHNKIYFTAAKKDGTKFYPNDYYMSGKDIATYPLIKHGHGEMYEIPLDVVLDERLERV